MQARAASSTEILFAAASALRGRRIGVVFQDPPPRSTQLTVGSQIAEPLVLHRGLSASEADRRAVGLLAEVGLPRPETIAAPIRTSSRTG
ncbi:MAG: hypothetical protein M5U08_13950 [Burkholderiales bacterium]|nr:hypothetical protein [Burkholderiales bacterium]